MATAQKATRPLSKWTEAQVVRFLDLALSGQSTYQAAVDRFYVEYPDAERYTDEYIKQTVSWFKAKPTRLSNYWERRKTEGENSSFGRAENRILALIRVAERIFQKLDGQFEALKPREVSDLSTAFRTTLSAITEEMAPGMSTQQVTSAFESLTQLWAATKAQKEVPAWARGFEQEIEQCLPTSKTPSN